MSFIEGVHYLQSLCAPWVAGPRRQEGGPRGRYGVYAGTLALSPAQTQTHHPWDYRRR
jgi:hypothetical protein